MDHLKILASDLKKKFSDLKQVYFPMWVMQPMLVNLSDVSIQSQELSEIENDESVKTNLFNIKKAMAWFVMRHKQNSQV